MNNERAVAKEATEEKVENNSRRINIRILDFVINKNYQYTIKNPIIKLVSDILYDIIAFPVLFILTKMMFGLKIQGRKNLRKVKNGAISMSNHIHPLDCAMVGLAMFPRKIFYTTIEENFKIPFVRRLIRLLNAIPIPKSIKNEEYFLKEIKELLRRKNIIHFYPESVLEPYSTELREFKNGAFLIATTNNKPIVPLVFSYREPKGIRRIIKRKPFLTLNVLPPIYPNTNLGKRQCVEELKKATKESMKNI